MEGKADHVIRQSQGDYDPGNHVECRQECDRGRTVQNLCPGRLPDCSFQVPEYGAEFLCHEGRPGDGPGTGHAGRVREDRACGGHEPDSAEAGYGSGVTGHCDGACQGKYECGGILCPQKGICSMHSRRVPAAVRKQRCRGRRRSRISCRTQSEEGRYREYGTGRHDRRAGSSCRGH